MIGVDQPLSILLVAHISPKLIDLQGVVMFLFRDDGAVGFGQHREHFAHAYSLYHSDIPDTQSSDEHQHDFVFDARMATFVAQGMVADELSRATSAEVVLFTA